MAQSPAHQPELAPDLARSDDLPVGAQLAWRLRVLIASGAARTRRPPSRSSRAGQRHGSQRQHGPRRLRPPGGGRADRLAPRPGHVRRRGRPGVARARTTGGRGRRQRTGQRRRSSRPGPGDLHRQRAGAEPRSSSPLGEAPEVDPADDPSRGDERLGRRELRRQIARLEAALASYPATPASRGEPTHPLLRPKGHVADMAELEEIRDELMERLKHAREAGGAPR